LSTELGLSGQGVATVGSVPSGLPGPRLPDAGLVADLLPVALGIALLAFLESVAAARAFRLRTDPPLNADRELLALGLANLCGGVFQAYPAAGGMSQTAVNDRFGARSQVAELVTAGCAALVLLFLAPYVGPLPQATLGGLVLVIAMDLIDLRSLRRIRAVRPEEFFLAMVALVGGATLGILPAVLIASLLSLLVLLYETNHPTVTSSRPEPGLLVVRVESRLYFANTRRVIERALRRVDQSEPTVRVLLLDLSVVSDLDYTAAEGIEEFHDELEHRNVDLWFAQPEARPRELLRRSGAQDRLDQEHRLFESVEDAIAEYRGSF
jgi:MFS superfamily sulfate permease-like transporter